MTKVLADQELRTKLGGLLESVELVDEQGNTLAVIHPMLDKSSYAGVEPPFSREELELRRKSTKWYTTEEVLKHLESL